MSKFFAPNIERKGRLIRGLGGILLLTGGIIALFFVWWLGLVLLASAAFVLFEALRGWCFMRACGLSTRL
jgi:hypothetical protein